MPRDSQGGRSSHGTKDLAVCSEAHAARWFGKLQTMGLALLDEAQGERGRPRSSWAAAEREEREGEAQISSFTGNKNDGGTRVLLSTSSTSPLNDTENTTMTTNGTLNHAPLSTPSASSATERATDGPSNGVLLDTLQDLQRKGLRQSRTLKSSAVDAAVIATGVAVGVGVCYGAYKLGAAIAND